MKMLVLLVACLLQFFTQTSALNCMTGPLIRNMEDGELLFDDMMSVECEERGQTQCWRYVATIQTDEYFVRMEDGGCLNPQYLSMYNSGAEGLKKYFEEEVEISDYVFDSCGETDCNNYRPEDSLATVKCMHGMVIRNADKEIIFSHAVERQCRVHQSCDTAMTSQTKNGVKTYFAFKSCGDPYKSRTYDNLRPVIPKTGEMSSTKEACSRIGCSGYHTGLCMCRRFNFDFDKYDKENQIDHPAVISCTGDLCNKDPIETISCMTGPLIRNMEDGELLFDDIMSRECDLRQGQTQCWRYAATIQTDEYQIRMEDGGCMNPQYISMYNSGAEGVKKYFKEDVEISDYVFNSCGETDCNNYRPEDSLATVKCMHGMTIRNADKEIIFSHAVERQCRVHQSCDTAMTSQTKNGVKTYFNFMSCGDPYKSRTYNNLRPVIPTTSKLSSTNKACEDIGCYGYHTGMCMCPPDFDFDEFDEYYNSVYPTVKSCAGDFCNREKTDLRKCMNGLTLPRSIYRHPLYRNSADRPVCRSEEMQHIGEVYYAGMVAWYSPLRCHAMCSYMKEKCGVKGITQSNLLLVSRREIKCVCVKDVRGMEPAPCPVYSCKVDDTQSKDPCADVTCQNGGTCIPSTKPVCMCPSGTFGKRCEQKGIDDECKARINDLPSIIFNPGQQCSNGRLEDVGTMKYYVGTIRFYSPYRCHAMCEVVKNECGMSDISHSNLYSGGYGSNKCYCISNVNKQITGKMVYRCIVM